MLIRARPDRRVAAVQIRDTEAKFVGEVLGQFVAQSSWESMSARMRHEAKRALLNYFACALGSAADPLVGSTARLMSPASGKPSCTVVGRCERLEPMGAAFVNAISANLLDYDDTHWRSAIHPTAPVAAAALALAEQRGLSGAALLHALMLGVEVECRIGNAVSPGHYARGMHITATCGIFGAAAASAKLLNLRAEGVWNALGIAASQSAGIIENLPTAAKNVAVGNAARNGLLAALMAREGYSAAPGAIEGPFGWAKALGDDFKGAEITHELGQHWELLSVAYKPYPCGFVFHAIIDACRELKAALPITEPDIVEVLVRGNQLLLDRGNRPVTTDRDARVSIAHTAAIGLLRGQANPSEFDAAAVSDPQLRALRSKVRAELSPEMPTGAARVTVTTRGGRSETVLVRHARGSPEKPLSDQELEAKFRACAQQSAAFSAQRIQALWAFDSAADVAAVVRGFAAP
jgi:2-methylcitrate dehydratase PrpD